MNENVQRCGQDPNELTSPSRLIHEIKHLFAARMRATETEADGVLTQHTARLILGCLSHHEAIRTADPARSDEPDLTQQMLAELTHMKPPTVSVTLSGMEEAGLIRRTPDPHDRRVIRITLTDAGRAVHERILERLKASDRVLMEGVTDEERAALISLLTRMRDNLLSDATTRDGLLRADENPSASPENSTPKGKPQE